MPGELHHLYVGCADTSIIKTDNATFIIDCHHIDEHVKLLPADKIIHALFITHQHHDHFSGMDFLQRKKYKINHLIYSPYKRRLGDNSVEFDEWNEFEGYKEYFQDNGTQLHSTYRQKLWDKPWWSPFGLKFWMIGPVPCLVDSETRELHDACLVFKVILGKRVCTFTGDSSDSSLDYIAKHTRNPCNDILHASHHGSINGGIESFIKKCNPKFTVISTESGVYDNIPHPTALARYKRNTSEKVYRLDESKSLKWKF